MGSIICCLTVIHLHYFQMMPTLPGELLELAQFRNRLFLGVQFGGCPACKPTPILGFPVCTHPKIDGQTFSLRPLKCWWTHKNPSHKRKTSSILRYSPPFISCVFLFCFVSYIISPFEIRGRPTTSTRMWNFHHSAPISHPK